VRTYSPKSADVVENWLVIDATDVVLGRLATQVATLLRGKHKATFAPHLDCGDYVIVVNASKVALTGLKTTDKIKYRHSGFIGGSRGSRSARPSRRSPSGRRDAVRGMLPTPATRGSRCQAQGVRGGRAPSRSAEAQGRSPSPRSRSRPHDEGHDSDGRHHRGARGRGSEEYHTETAIIRGVGASAIAPGKGLGRPKEAIARVRLVQGSASGRSTARPRGLLPKQGPPAARLEPFAVLDIENKFDVHARITGGG